MIRRRLLRTASVIFIVLGVGHLMLAAVITRDTLTGWVAAGGWAAVPLLGSQASPDAALNSLAFWGGPGSFAVPLAILGVLVWQLAGRDIRVPAFVGWTIAAWCLAAALILVPSPFVLGTLAGLLVVLAARRVPVPSA